MRSALIGGQLKKPYRDPVTNKLVKPRNCWPNITPIQDKLNGLHDWVKRERIVADKSVADNVFYVRRLLSLLVLPDGVDPSSLEVLVSMYKTNTVGAILLLPMMHREVPWSRKCATAFGYYAKYHLDNANRAGQIVDASVCNALLAMVEGWAARATVAHREATCVRGEYDAARLSCLPSIGRLK